MAMFITKKQGWNCLEKAEFLIRIGTLIEQGYTITEGVELFLKYEKETVKPTLISILEKLQEGSPISGALNVLKLPKFIISFVYFAEHYGDIAKGLIDGGNLLKKTEESKAKFQKLIRYPLFLIWILSLFMIIMYRYLFPQFTQLFSTINIELPLITRVFLNIINKSPAIISLLLAILVTICIYYFFIYRKKNVFHKAQFISKIPIVGNFFRVVMTYLFATNLSCLIKSGLSIYDALVIFKTLDNLGYISNVSGIIMEKLESGERLQHVLIKNTLYLKGLAYIVEHGQANGRLVEELDYYSQWLLVDLEEKIKKLFMVIQPLLFLFIGIIILLMFASILIPMFSLINGL